MDRERLTAFLDGSNLYTSTNRQTVRETNKAAESARGEHTAGVFGSRSLQQQD
jgi:hypothetical protein